MVATAIGVCSAGDVTIISRGRPMNDDDDDVDVDDNNDSGSLFLDEK